MALQRHPAYRIAVVNRRHAWLFAVAGDRIDTVTQPAAAGVRGPRYGGWYGLESHRVNERIAELTHHHFHDIADILAQAIRPGQERLVVGGHADTIPQFLAILPPDLRDRFAGSFVADTSTMTPARARAPASPIIRNWVEKSGKQLVTRIRPEPPGGLAATALAACLTAVRQHAIHILAMPGRGLVPGSRAGGAARSAPARPAAPTRAARYSPSRTSSRKWPSAPSMTAARSRPSPTRPAESPPGSGSRSAAATEPSHHGQHAGHRATTGNGEHISLVLR